MWVARRDAAPTNIVSVVGVHTKLPFTCDSMNRVGGRPFMQKGSRVWHLRFNHARFWHHTQYLSCSFIRKPTMSQYGTLEISPIMPVCMPDLSNL